MPHSSQQSCIWLRNTGQLWKVDFGVWVAMFGYSVLMASGLLLIGAFFWSPCLYVMIGLWGLYLLGYEIETLVVYRLIKCPHCGHNPTRRKSDGKMMSPSIMYPRLSTLTACPNCGEGA